MDEANFDLAKITRLSKCLGFICGQDHPVTVALNAAAISGTERDIKRARRSFMKLKLSERRAALAMLAD